MAEGEKLMSHKLMAEATAKINRHETARNEIQAEFELITKVPAKDYKGRPTIDYVVALENKIIRLREVVKGARAEHRGDGKG